MGKGYRHAEFNGFNIPIEESEARFDEALDVMLKAWGAKKRFPHPGRFWTFNDIIVEPTIPTRPAMWMGAGSESSIRKVAARSFNLLLDQFADAKLTGQRIEMFKTAIKEQGRAYDPKEVAVARDLFIAKDEQDKEAALERLNTVRQRTINHARAPNQAKGSHILSYAKGGEMPSTESTLVAQLGDGAQHGAAERPLQTAGSSQTCRLTSTHRTARCGPACRVVWQGTRRPYRRAPMPIIGKDATHHRRPYTCWTPSCNTHNAGGNRKHQRSIPRGRCSLEHCGARSRRASHRP